jgi:hypothetical protein
MQVRSEKNDLERRANEVQQQGAKTENDLQEYSAKLQRANQSKDSKLNNVRAVRGQNFDQTPTYFQILTEVE